MTDLTATELTRLRRRIGDNESPYALSDDELNDVFDEAENDLDRATLLALEALAAALAKATDYTQNDTQEKRSQAFDHVMKVLIPYWQEKLNRPNQIKIVGMAQRPPREKDEPAGREEPQRRLRRRWN